MLRPDGVEQWPYDLLLPFILCKIQCVRIYIRDLH